MESLTLPLLHYSEQFQKVVIANEALHCMVHRAK